MTCKFTLLRCDKSFFCINIDIQYEGIHKVSTQKRGKGMGRGMGRGSGQKRTSFVLVTLFYSFINMRTKEEEESNI